MAVDPTISYYQKKYQIYPFIPETIKKIKYYVDKFIPHLPLTAKKNNVTYKIRNIFNYLKSNLDYYAGLKNRLVKGSNFYFKTKMDQRTNELYNPILVRLSKRVRDYERSFFKKKDEILPALKKAEESGVAAVGIAPLIFLVPIVTAGAGYITHLLTKESIVEVDMRKKLLDYDVQTLETANKMKATGVPEKDIRAYITSRETGIDRTLVTDAEKSKKKSGFIERIAETAGRTVRRAMPMMAIAGVAVLGVLFFMGRRRR